ncbi:hypothetical protein [Arthrobacter sp. NyZ413]|uniref:hypothetical protein n=1 Tax=Arthrobacter sp. NyZ413 TaxID=3144669 RepID=UPI002BF62EFA|nr:hypothetical protein [Arthrobacter sp.]
MTWLPMTDEPLLILAKITTRQRPTSVVTQFLDLFESVDVRHAVIYRRAAVGVGAKEVTTAAGRPTLRWPANASLGS